MNSSNLLNKISKPKVKICGITNLIDAKNALNLGADYLGFINLDYSLRYLPLSEIAKILQVDPKTVTNVGSAYCEAGLKAALFDEEQALRPIDFDDRERSRIVAMVCSDPPVGYYRWTLDLIVDEAQKRELIEGSISRETVRVILQEHDLKPWQEKMWCIGHLDAEYIQKMEDVLDAYERPYNEKKPLVCLDEKPVPLIADTRERIPPAGPGDVLKKDYEYARNGKVFVFCAVEPKAGRYLNKVTDTRTGVEFAQFIKCVESQYRDAERIVLVMDNLSTHSEKFLIERYGETEGKALWSRFDVHYTPKHGSWLNQAEIAIGMYSRQCLGDGRLGTKENLIEQTKAWNQRTNRKQVKIHWRFTKSKARKSLDYKLSGYREKLI